MASRVLFINEGRLVYDGAFSKLTGDGKPLDVHFRELSERMTAVGSST